MLTIVVALFCALSPTTQPAKPLIDKPLSVRKAARMMGEIGRCGFAIPIDVDSGSFLAQLMANTGIYVAYEQFETAQEYYEMTASLASSFPADCTMPHFRSDSPIQSKQDIIDLYVILTRSGRFHHSIVVPPRGSFLTLMESAAAQSTIKRPTTRPATEKKRAEARPLNATNRPPRPRG